MAEYRGNSIKDREQKKPTVEKVTVGEVSVKKKSGIEKFVSALFAENISNLKDYYIFEVIAPTVKRSLRDVLVSGIESIFGVKTSSRSGETRYHSAYSSDRGRTYTSVSGNVFDYNHIEFNDRGDAEVVLETMYDILERYGVVSVSDFYDAAGVAGNATDTKWGWRNLSGSRVVTQAGGGFVIKLPRAQSID